ncbi:MAG: rod-binding protein [Phycisphaerae bacterium]|nr:rod-binding protein [Phycisphaerae bacterium]
MQLKPDNVTEIQARSALQADRALNAAQGLHSSEMRDRLGRLIQDPEQRDKQLRERIDELVGITFFGTLLKTMRDSNLKGPYGHGGRGEEVFQGQFDQLLAQRLGKTGRFGLSEAIYRRMTRNAKAAPTQTTGKVSPLFTTSLPFAANPWAEPTNESLMGSVEA